jgi:hypothetical protein
LLPILLVAIGYFLFKVMLWKAVQEKVIRLSKIESIEMKSNQVHSVEPQCKLKKYKGIFAIQQNNKMNQLKSVVLLVMVFFTQHNVKAQSNIHPKSTVQFEVENPISTQRANETVTIPAIAVDKAFHKAKTTYVQIKELKTNRILITQPVDYNQDGIVDEFVFQTDFEPNEKKKFELSQQQSQQQSSTKVFAAYLPTKEGMQDFSWENDLIGYRFYGQERARIQGTGIAMDVWCKRIPDLLTEKWYVPGQSYHKDTGYGADHYNSGKNQGCGGSGLLKNDSITFSEPFFNWKIITNGPIRVVFELQFSGWKFNQNIVETKRVTLDAGTYFNKIESSYNISLASQSLRHVVSFVQRPDSESHIEKEHGTATNWESLGKDNGNLGTGFIADPAGISKIFKKDNHLVCQGNSVNSDVTAYYTGAAWDQFGGVLTYHDWNTLVKQQALRIANPCIIRFK